MASNVKTLADQKYHCHAKAAEHFEVHPDVMEGKGNKQVGGTGHYKNTTRQCSVCRTGCDSSVHGPSR